MNRRNLDEVEFLLDRARRVVPMREIADGDLAPEVIGMRHDVDDNNGSLDTAFAIAEWEAERGFRSTYYLLHDSHYWPRALEEAHLFQVMGHEVGIHVNAIAEGLRQRRNPEIILGRAIDQLRSAGCDIVGCAAHGDTRRDGYGCYRADRTLRFVNDEMFTQSRRPSMGEPNRYIEDDFGFGYYLQPTSRKEFGLEYDAAWLPHGDSLSDSGGTWSQPIEGVSGRFGHCGQVHILMHPDWWAEAFAEVSVG